MRKPIEKLVWPLNQEYGKILEEKISEYKERLVNKSDCTQSNPEIMMYNCVAGYKYLIALELQKLSKRFDYHDRFLDVKNFVFELQRRKAHDYKRFYPLFESNETLKELSTVIDEDAYDSAVRVIQEYTTTGGKNLSKDSKLFKAL